MKVSEYKKSISYYNSKAKLNNSITLLIVIPTLYFIIFGIATLILINYNPFASVWMVIVLAIILFFLFSYLLSKVIINYQNINYIINNLNKFNKTIYEFNDYVGKKKKKVCFNVHLNIDNKYYDILTEYLDNIDITSGLEFAFGTYLISYSLELKKVLIIERFKQEELECEA